MTLQYIYPPLNADSGAAYQQFVSFMQANIPNWQAYSGELDDWLARAFAGQQATLTELASDVATQIYRWYGANIVNVPPYDAVAATGSVSVTVRDTVGYTIPAFTPFGFTDGTGATQFFENPVDVIVAAGSTTAAVAVQAQISGAAGNGCSGSATPPLAFITSAVMSTPSADGADPEPDTDFLNRLTQELTTLSPAPISTDQFTILAAAQQGVGRATSIGGFNPANWTTSGTLASGSPNVTVAATANIPIGAPVSGTNVPAGTFVKSLTSSTVFVMSANATASGAQTLTIGGAANQPGYVTSWVADSNGAALTTLAMTAVQSAIQAKCLEGVVYSVEAPFQNAVNVTVTGACWPGVDPVATKAAVQAAITAYLQPGAFGQPINPVSTTGQTYGWLNDNMVRQSALEALVMNTAGMHYVSSLQINGVAGDCALEGIVPTTTPGTITVTLVAA